MADYVAVAPVTAVTVNEINRVIQDFNLRMLELLKRLEDQRGPR